MDEHAEKLMAAIQTFLEAFPDARCLRCGSEDFGARLTSDIALSPAFRSNELFETVCKRCGYREGHVLAALEDAIEAGELPRKDESVG